MREKLAKKKNGAGEFQGATRSSGPENEMLVGSLVFLLSARRWVKDEEERKGTSTMSGRVEMSTKGKTKKEKSNLFIISRPYVRISTTRKNYF